MDEQSDLKTWSTETLIARARVEVEGDAYWSLVVELQCRGGRTELDACCQLVASADPAERALGADILGQLGTSVTGRSVWRNEAIALLRPLLRDPEAEVRGSAAYSLGHRIATEAVAELAALVGDESPFVRLGVAFALGGMSDATAVTTLLRLCADGDFDVRNWATFGVAQQTDADDAAIRDVLFHALSDAEWEIRGEAMVGLALRHDLRVIPYVEAELAGEFLGSYGAYAAKALADIRFCSALKRIRQLPDVVQDAYFTGELDDAIRACCGDGAGGTDT